MLLPHKMCYAYIISHKEVSDRIITALHREGFMQMEYLPSDEISKLKKVDESEKFKDIFAKINHIRLIYNRVSKGSYGMLRQILKPTVVEKIPVEEYDQKKLLKDAEEFIEKEGNKLFELEKKLDHIEKEVEKIKEYITWIRQLLPFNLDLKYIGDSPLLYSRVGYLKDLNVLVEKCRDLPVAIWSSEVVRGKKVVGWVVVVLALQKNRREVESALRFASFEEYSLPAFEGTPQEVLNNLEERLKDLNSQRNSIIQEIEKSLEINRNTFGRIWDEIYNYREREIFRNKLLGTDQCIVIGGWIRKKDSQRLEKVVEESSNGLAIVKIRDAADGEDAPVYYSNPRIIKPFEAFIDMFSPPKYREIDPTLIVAISFVLFFGLTLGDAFYGIILLVASVLLMRAGKTSWSFGTLGKIMFASSISTIIFGFLGGNFMGPLDDRNPWVRFLNTMGFKVPTDIKYPLDSVRDPIYILVLSLLIGLFFIMLGITLGAYQDIKKRDFKTLVQKRISWYLLIPFGGLLIGRFFNWWTLSEDIEMISKAMTLIGIGMLFYDGKIMNVFDITGFIGNWLSYARLLALGLATAGLALTINVLADILIVMLGVYINIISLAIGIAIIALAKKIRTLKKVGYIFGVIIISLSLVSLVLGSMYPVIANFSLSLFLLLFYSVCHVGNSILQALGSFVHSLRLQYVEFFSQFYEGGGRKFSPFCERRLYTRLEVKK